MSVSAQKVDDLYCDGIQCQTECQTVVDGDTSKLQWRDHWTIALSRKFSGLTAFYPENKTTQSSFRFKTAANVSCTWSYGNKKFFCTSDEPEITDSITGEGTERQVWEHYTDWEDIPATHYP